MNIVDFGRDRAMPLGRPGCTGMSGAPVVMAGGMSCTALYLAPHAFSDQHSAPFPQMLVVRSGRGWVSVGRESREVHAGQAIELPPGSVHRFWTGDDAMETLALAWNESWGRALVIAPDQEFYRRSAEWFILYAQAALRDRGRFRVALSGGSTPRGLYELLAGDEFRPRIDWRAVEFFWGDERAVPPEHPDSNFRMACDTLISKLDVDASQVHRMMGERNADEAARAYEAELRAIFPGEPFPRLDLVLLGLGENGHTASLFPGTRVLQEKTRWVAAERIQEIGAWRITLTAPAINSASNVMFLVSGAGKGEMMRTVWESSRSSEDVPALLIAPVEGDLIWLVDESAAQLIPHVQ